MRSTLAGQEVWRQLPDGSEIRTRLSPTGWVTGHDLSVAQPQVGVPALDVTTSYRYNDWGQVVEKVASQAVGGVFPNDADWTIAIDRPSPTRLDGVDWYHREIPAGQVTPTNILKRGLSFELGPNGRLVQKQVLPLMHDDGGAILYGFDPLDRVSCMVDAGNLSPSDVVLETFSYSASGLSLIHI